MKSEKQNSCFIKQKHKNNNDYGFHYEIRLAKQGADQSCSLFLRVPGLRVKAQTRAYPLWAMIKSRNGKKYPPSVIVHRRKHKKRGEGLLPLLSKKLDFTRNCGALLCISSGCQIKDLGRHLTVRRCSRWVLSRNTASAGISGPCRDGPRHSAR